MHITFWSVRPDVCRRNGHLVSTDR